MAQNYNVDDILEEIRRKKEREAAQQETRRDTYGAPAQADADLPRRREEPEPRRQPPRGEAPSDRTAPRRAPLSGFGQEAGHAFGQGSAPRYSGESIRASRSAPQEPPRAARYPAREEPVRRASHYEEPRDDGGFRDAPLREEPLRAPRHEDAPQEPPRAARYPAREEPVRRAPRYEEPRRGGDDGKEPARETPRRAYDDEEELPAVPPEETLSETIERLRRSRGEAGRAPAPREAAGEDFAFGGVPGEPETFPPPAWEETPAAPASGGEFGFRFRFDEPEDEGTRMDIPPRPRRAAPSGRTQEIGTGAARRAREQEPQGLSQSKWRQSYAEQEALEQVVPEDDFGSPEDAPYVEKDLKAIRTGLTVKQVLTAALAFLSLYLALSLRALPFAGKFGIPEGYLLPLPPVIAPENNMRLFLIVNLVLVVLAAIICSSIVGGGIAALCRMRANSDSPAALAVLAVLIQGIVLAVLPDAAAANENVSLYFPVALAALLFTLFGKKMMMKRIGRNFGTLTSEEEKYALVQIQNREFAREFSRGLGPDVDRVAYSARTGFVTGFLDRSYAPDYSESFSCISTPICLAGALVVGVAGFFLMDNDLPSAISAFAAVLCICAPFSAALVPNLMLYKQSGRLARKGAVLAGYTAAEDYADTGAVIVSDRELFFDDSVMLHGMKVFAEKRIDEAILDAASVIISCGGIMSGVFLNMIGGNRRMLKKVDSLMYEDGMGLSAWVDGKRVLIGSHELMRNHDIDCPSRDFEARYTRDGRQVLYIANSGELSAMFVVSYNADPEVADALAALERRGVSVALYTTDPNITSELVAATFGIRRSSVRILPAKIHGEYTFLVKPKERISAGGVHAGGLAGALGLLRAASAVKRSVMRATIVQLVGVVAGYGLVAFMAFTGSLRLASCGALLLFGLAWYLVTRISASAGG